MKNLFAFSLALTFLGLASGCSSDDSGGGGSSVDPLVRAACDKQTADCGEDTECVADVGKDNAIAEVFGCTAEYDAVLKCMAEAQWECTGFETFSGVDACSSIDSDYRKCAPGYSYSGGLGSSCEGSLYFPDGTASASCNGGSCTCSEGDKSGATFSLSDCDTIPLFKGIAANCH
ncbi:MAG: hypothetical protein H6718_28680 [Polyangiaceae bacterium]|nr:hypothetical protein [Polyangiaceae bacterium]